MHFATWFPGITLREPTYSCTALGDRQGRGNELCHMFTLRRVSLQAIPETGRLNNFATHICLLWEDAAYCTSIWQIQVPGVLQVHLQWPPVTKALFFSLLFKITLNLQSSY